MAQDDATTPYRRTLLELDVPETVLVRPALTERREASSIGRGQRAAAARENVFLAGGEGLILRPFYSELAQSIKAENQSVTPPGGRAEGTALGAADVNTVPSLVAENMWHAPTELPGIGVAVGSAAGEVIDHGIPGFRRRVASGAVTWADELAADVAALPKPADPVTQIVPLDRVLSGRISYPESTPFAIRFFVPRNWTGQDSILRFYFGGEAATQPQETTGGQFALTVRGGGTALLQEWDGAAWQDRMSFEWDRPHLLAGSQAMLTLVPFGRNRLTVITPGNPVYAGGGGASLLGLLLTLTTASLGQAGVAQHLYRDVETNTGHVHLTATTGAGSVRLDLRRDHRIPVSIFRGKYPETGFIEDGPLRLRLPVPGGTPLTLRTQTFLPPGTGISAAVYDAETRVALATDAQGRFLANDGQLTYYVRLSLQSTDGTQTPVLWAYELSVPPQFAARETTPLTGDLEITDVSVTGPDLTPDHESASVKLSDRLDTLALLRVRDRIHARLAVVDARSGAVISYLFEGETAQAKATQRGADHFAGIGQRGALAYPSARWHDYDVPLVGMWARLADQVSLSLLNFSQDQGAPPDPNTGEYPPWQVTDIVRYLLNGAGVPDEQIDVPDDPLRLFVLADSQLGDYLLQVTASYAEFIQRLAHDYLGCVLLRDPNAGSAGMWRLRPNPAPPYTNFLGHFVFGPPAPASGPRVVTHPGAYPSDTTWIQRQSFVTYVRAPEINYLAISAVGEVLPEPDGGHEQLSQFMWNPASFDLNGVGAADPLTPAFLGRFVPGVVFDPLLRTPAALDFYTRRLMSFAGEPQKWARFRAPLLLIWDRLDPLQTFARPLRVNDLVTVQGYPAFVRSCNPNYKKSTHMLADYEVLFLL